jgi:hypothetical protein
MSNVQKIFLGIFMLLGILEVVSNLYHLTRWSMEKIGRSAGKQHGELPKGLSSEHYVAKAITMELFGIAFLGIGILMILQQKFLTVPVLATLIAFGVYALCPGSSVQNMPECLGDPRRL